VRKLIWIYLRFTKLFIYNKTATKYDHFAAKVILNQIMLFFCSWFQSVFTTKFFVVLVTFRRYCIAKN